MIITVIFLSPLFCFSRIYNFWFWAEKSISLGKFRPDLDVFELLLETKAKNISKSYFKKSFKILKYTSVSFSLESPEPPPLDFLPL